MEETILAEGAEAKIFLTKNCVQKSRIQKTYRHPRIDQQIRKSRTKHEAKILHKAKGFGISVPNILNLNKKLEPANKFILEIEYINGEKLSETLNHYSYIKQKSVMTKLGKEVAIMHDNDIIHGDLTTSNIILKNSKIYLIDFGLGFFSKKIEDKAVDLHLIKQALEAKHWKKYEKLFEAFLKGYKHNEAKKIVDRLKIVEMRGRYKH